MATPQVSTGQSTPRAEPGDRGYPTGPKQPGPQPALSLIPIQPTVAGKSPAGAGADGRLWTPTLPPSVLTIAECPAAPPPSHHLLPCQAPSSSRAQEGVGWEPEPEPDQVPRTGPIWHLGKGRTGEQPGRPGPRMASLTTLGQDEGPEGYWEQGQALPGKPLQLCRAKLTLSGAEEELLPSLPGEYRRRSGRPGGAGPPHMAEGHQEPSSPQDQQSNPESSVYRAGPTLGYTPLTPWAWGTCWERPGSPSTGEPRQEET